MKAFRGDTLASALIANGIRVVGRSLKYHRPRGFYGVGVEDPNSMLAVRDAYGYDPAIRAGQVYLSEGLVANSLTGWPSPDVDVAGALQMFSRLLGAGFYYKTFMRPNWHLFEPIIRKAAGFGKLLPVPYRRTVYHRHEVCDVLVIGGGPAGLAAASPLIHSGLKTFIVDDQSAIGGSLRWEDASIDDLEGSEWVQSVASRLKEDPHIRILNSTTITAAYEANFFTAVQSFYDEGGLAAELHWTLRAQHVVLASGMIDRPLVFPDNDRPGVMLSSSVRRLIGEFGVAPSRKLAIYTNNDSAYLTALAAQKAGIVVPALVDTRDVRQTLHAKKALSAGIDCFFSSQIIRTEGSKGLTAITVRNDVGSLREISCGALAISGGFTPSIQLAAHRGNKPVFDEKLNAWMAADLPPGWQTAGGAAGNVSLDETLATGYAAGEQIASLEGVTCQRFARSETRSMSYGAVGAHWKSDYGQPSRMWVDLQNDVKVSDIIIASQENYRSVEHLKRYTTLGMGTDQGRTSNSNGLAILADLTGSSIASVGTTTFRPPYTGVRMAAIANARQGNGYRPRRYLPAHRLHEMFGAVFEDFGWERPDWYGSNGVSREAAVAVEMAAVRNHVGVFDGSSLGKIEITGPDAATFLSRFYVSNMMTLKPGRVRYSVMLKDDGVIFDDGVVACIGENHFLAGPTSGHAEAVASWFERWRQTEFASLRVAISPVTSNWASIAIAGPRARELLAWLGMDIDISSEAFPHMHFREARIGNVPARVARVSFTGELQYEISVPSRYALSLQEALLTARDDLTPRPIGMEAWLRLRLEKGYIHVGADTNGRTTPLDIGMEGIVSKRKDDFIGKRSLALSFARSKEREQLVGLVALEGTLKTGGRIMAPGYIKAPCPTEGYVTSACYSPSTGGWIGLALVERGYERKGEVVSVFSGKNRVQCKICDPIFYDPTNERLN